MQKNKLTSVVPISLEVIIKNLPELAYVFSKDGKLLTWNKNVETLLQYSAEELQDKFVTEIICDNDKDRVAGKFLKLIADGDDIEQVIEYCVQTKKGNQIRCLAKPSVVIIDDIQYMVGIQISINNIKNKDRSKHEKKINTIKQQLRDYYIKIKLINKSVAELQNNIFINTKEFNRLLLNNLPGLFFLCENIDDKYYIKKWNDNLITKFGYSEIELFNMQFFQTLANPKEYKKVDKAIKDVFINGKTQFNTVFKTRAGKHIPYFFEVYRLENNGKSYFMGIGIDIKEKLDLEKKHEQEKREKNEAQDELSQNKTELITTAIEISNNSIFIKNIVSKINKIIDKHDSDEVCDDLINIKKEIENQIKELDNWEIFKLQFTKVHKGFFNKLKITHPSLTKSELIFCAYLRMYLSSNQISNILNITYEAVKKNRYRIRKKIGLNTKDSLDDYISKF